MFDDDPVVRVGGTPPPPPSQTPSSLAFHVEPVPTRIDPTRWPPEYRRMKGGLMWAPAAVPSYLQWLFIRRHTEHFAQFGNEVPASFVSDNGGELQVDFEAMAKAGIKYWDPRLNYLARNGAFGKTLSSLRDTQFRQFRRSHIRRLEFSSIPKIDLDAVYNPMRPSTSTGAGQTSQTSSERRIIQTRSKTPAGRTQRKRPASPQAAWEDDPPSLQPLIDYIDKLEQEPESGDLYRIAIYTCDLTYQVNRLQRVQRTLSRAGRRRGDEP